jgi:hypothetical protein
LGLEAAGLCAGTARTLIALALSTPANQQQHTSDRNTGDPRMQNNREIQTADFRASSRRW